MRAKKILSMLLVLVMMLSLFPMNAFALGGGREIGIGGGFGRDIGDDEIREFDPTDYEEEGEDPVDYFQATDTESGITVTVESPFNALPTKAEVRLQPVDPESVREAVESVVEGQPNILVAMDISFWLDGQEIEPDRPVNVKISAPEIMGRSDLQVVHIPDAGEEAAMPNTVQLITEEEMTLPVGTNEIAFKADSFSVYAVIGEGEEGDNARLTVIFHTGDTPEPTMYLKKSDVPDHVNGIIYDPGVPSVSGKMFMGWTTNPNYASDESFNVDKDAMDLAAVRTLASTMVSAEGLKEGDKLELYPVLLKVFYLYFEDENEIVFKTQSIFLKDNETSSAVTINTPYSTTQLNLGFVGWAVKGTESPIYKNGSNYTLSADTSMVPVIKAGHWLFFDENDGGSGVGDASYTPPAFIPGSETCAEYEPTNPTRPGYTFDGWYTAATGGTRFNFGDTLDSLGGSESMTVYARWTANETAKYKVIIWTQSVNDDKTLSDTEKTYDYYAIFDNEDLVVPSDTEVTDTLVDPYAHYGNSFFGVTDLANGSYAFVYRTFKVENGSGSNRNCISASGDTVINVYYDRALFSIRFTGVSGGTTQYYYPVDNGTDVYALIDGEFVPLTTTVSNKRIEWSRVNGKLAVPDNITQVYYSDKSGSSTYLYSNQIVAVSGLYSPNGKKLLEEAVGATDTKAKLSASAYTKYNLYSTTSVQYGDYCQLRWTIKGEYSYSYNGEPYTGQLYERSSEVVYTGLYGQEFSKYGYTWKTPGENKRWFGVSYLDSFNGNLFGHSNHGGTPNWIELKAVSETPDVTILFWTQNAEKPANYDFSGSAKYNIAPGPNGTYNITDRIQGMESAGYAWSTSDAFPTYSSSWHTELNDDGYTLYSRPDADHAYLHIKYDRLVNDIVFMNGSVEVKRIEGVRFGESLEDYESQAPEIPVESIPEGYYFAGWYNDPTGQQPATWTGTMPLANKVLYAKIAPVQYHVIVDLNGGTVENQSTNFWVPYNTVLDDTNFNNATYTLDGNHSLVGYYTDANFTTPWNFSTKLTNDSMAILYSGPDDPLRVDYQDNGFDSTVGVFFLYARWRDDSIITQGGLRVRYAYDKADGTTGYIDDPMHYADLATVIATAAPAQSEWPAGKKFDAWRLNNTTNYYPTQSFVADSQFAVDHVITLEAVYVDLEPETPTHIYWYANNGTNGVQKYNNLQINKGVDIPTTANWTDTTSRAAGDGLVYAGHVFLGWARVAEGTSVSPTSLTVDDLFLKWVNATDTAGAHYEAKDDGKWVTVTQVACDEETPYHDMYAVWATAFYVYHTGTNKVERILLSGDSVNKDGSAKAFDLTALVDTSNFLYGGYYKAYTGVSENFSAESLFWKLPAASAYTDGTQMSAYASAGLVSNSSDRGTAYTGANIGQVSFDQVQTVPGNAIQPEAGAVYYIKEVPAKDFLQPRLRYTYRSIDGKIGTAWLATNLDDNSYGAVGFMIGDAPVVCTDGDKVTSFTMVPNTDKSQAVTYYVGTEPEGSGTKQPLFPMGSFFSYQKVYNDPNLYENKPELNVAGEVDILKANQKVVMFWVTPDGMKVTSTATRTYQGIETTAMSIKDKADQTSAITLYSAS